MNNNIKSSVAVVTLIVSLSLSACNQENSAKDADSKKTESPALGTDIKEVVNPASDEKADAEVRKIVWKDLIPKGFEPEVTMKKYEKLINNMSEGAEGEQALLDKIMDEFNNAPSNKELDGIKIKMPGFVSPLDEKDGMVSEFLLVPYFGSCIHSPPPPVNQTVLVTPQTGKSIPIEDINKPVWVTGNMKVETKETELAKAGYLIQDAEIEIFKRER